MKPPLLKDEHPAESARASHRTFDPSHTQRINPNGLDGIPAQVESSRISQELPATDPVHPQGTNPILNNLVFLLMGCLLTYAATFLTRQPDLPAIQLQPPPTVAPTAPPAPTAMPEPFTVFVSGGVQAPGLYEVQDGARVGDVLAMAGGLLDDADASIINQAERLFDGAQIHVPMSVEITVTEFDAEPAKGSTPPLLVNQPPAGISGAPAAALPLAGSSSAGLINVNSATAAELETLPGVGASRAAEIIAGRPYSAIDDLQKVSGIGAKTVEKLRPLVSVE